MKTLRNQGIWQDYPGKAVSWGKTASAWTKCPCEKRHRASFTLIELLVVIAIIAILFTSENNFLVSVYVNGVLEKVCGTNRYHV